LALRLRDARDVQAADLVEKLCDSVERAHRQVVRLRLDLHDESLQDMTALRNDLQLFRTQVDRVLETSGDRRRMVGRVDDFLARVGTIDEALRELAVPTKAPTALEHSLATTVRAIVEAYPGECVVELHLDPDLDSSRLTESQRIAIVRVIQSALANILQHSDAEHASITLRLVQEGLECEIVDDGPGFPVDETLRLAAGDRRLGVAGMRERIVMLGGTFEIASAVGGPTRVSFRLPVGLRAPGATPGRSSS